MKKEFKQSRWNLKDLLSSNKGKDYNIFLSNLNNNVSKFESYKNKLSQNISKETFIEIIKLSEVISEQASILTAYSYLQFSTDTKSQESRAFMNNIENLTAEISNKMLFFYIWFKELDDNNANRLIENTGDYKYYLDRLRAFKKYTLSEKEEKIITLKDVTGVSALNSIYTVFTSSFKYSIKIKNKTKYFNQSELIAFVRSQNPKLREQAYKSLFNEFSKHRDVLGDIYKNIATNWKNDNLTLRGYSSPISVRNIGNDVSDKSIDVLLDVVKNNSKLFHRYFRLKSKILKIKMSRYHLYAPSPSAKGNINYSKAINIVLDCYNSFSPELSKAAESVITKQHIDSLISDSKKSGAYCYNISPSITPYVLINYDNTERNVSTLAHELGHAVHDILASKHSILTFHAPLILAETASVFGENIVRDKLLELETNKKNKQAILMSALDDAYATILRQAYFVIFEKQAHDMISKGATIDELSDAYFKLLKEQFGNSIIVPEEFKYEWTYIPHIYENPFYCYAYSFGNLLVLALYQMYKSQGKSFVPKYLKLLSYGGSKKPSEVLKELDIDIEDEKFWQKGFDVIKDMIDELEKLS